jgi:hypothetical protein
MVAVADFPRFWAEVEDGEPGRQAAARPHEVEKRWQPLRNTGSSLCWSSG